MWRLSAAMRFSQETLGNPHTGPRKNVCVTAACHVKDAVGQSALAERGPWEQHLRNDKECLPCPIFLPTFQQDPEGRGPRSRSLCWVTDGGVQRLHSDGGGGLSVTSQMAICDTEKRILFSKTGLGFKTKSSHKVVDLLGLSLKNKTFMWKRIFFFLTAHRVIVV